MNFLDPNFMAEVCILLATIQQHSKEPIVTIGCPFSVGPYQHIDNLNLNTPLNLSIDNAEGLPILFEYSSLSRESIINYLSDTCYIVRRRKSNYEEIRMHGATYVNLPG